MRPLLGAPLFLLATALLLYASPWWPWREVCGWTAACADGRLFGVGWLPQQGDLATRWLRGTWFAESALLVWAVAAFLILSALQRLWDALAR